MATIRTAHVFKIEPDGVFRLNDGSAIGAFVIQLIDEVC
jgi:hypothetical protein